MTSPTTQFLALDSGRLAYDVQGDGPLVVCAPGMGDLRGVYRAVVPDLVRAGHRVVTVDLRGHGESDATFDRYDDVATGGDLLALVEHLGGPAVLLGNSMSAGSAVWAAAERPDLVSGLALLGPFVRDVPTPWYQRLLFRLLLLRPWGRAAWLAWYRKLYPGRVPVDLDEHRAAMRASLARAAHWKAFVATSRTTHAPAEARLAEVSCPTLVVMGGRDPDFPDPAGEAHHIAAALDARVLIVPEAGHYPQAEFPELVVPALLSLLATARA